MQPNSIDKKTPEEKILGHLAARRQRNGTPTYKNPDFYETETCRENGIDIDFDSAKDSGEPPTNYQ